MRTLFRLVFVVLLGLSLGSFASAQEMLLEKSGTRTLLVFPDGQVLSEESWEVILHPGENLLNWQKPERVRPEEISIRINGAQLESMVYPKDSTLALLRIHSAEEKKATVKALYPLRDCKAEFLYQLIWEKDAANPRLYFYLLLSGGETPAPGNLTLQVLGQTYPIYWERGVPQRLLLAEKEIEAEQFIRYLSGQAQTLSFWKLKVPPELQVKGKVECFEKNGESLTFLGEAYFRDKEAYLEFPLGSAEDVIVKETLVLREKTNRLYSRWGEEVLYDTLEEKVYQVENRGEKAKRIQIHQEVHPSSRVISATCPVQVEEPGLLSLDFELEAQQETAIHLKIQGEKLTWGWAFKS